MNAELCIVHSGPYSCPGVRTSDERVYTRCADVHIDRVEPLTSENLDAVPDIYNGFPYMDEWSVALRKQVNVFVSKLLTTVLKK